MNFIKKLLGSLKNNLKTVLLSLIIAVVFWMFVSIQIFPTIEERINDIIIDVQRSDYMMQNNLQIVSTDYEALVDIKIEGKRYDISGLNADDFYASIDFSTVRGAGTYTLPITVTANMGAEYTLLDTEPRSVTLKIDEIVTREFTVTATAPNISLPEGYYADTVTSTPGVVMLTGSASVLDRVNYVEARSVFSGEITESHETQSEIIIYGANGGRIIDNEIRISPENVSVYIPIYKQKELPLTFTLTNYPSNFDISSLGYEIQPKSIIVAAPDDSIDYLSELELDPIDITDIRLNQTVQIPIKLPEGYKNLSGNNNARIVWDIADYGKLDFAVNNINISNEPDNFEVSTITKELSISVIGPSDEISGFTASDFYITANLLGVSLREGAQDVAVDIRVKGANRRCWIAGSYKITINAVPKAEEG